MKPFYRKCLQYGLAILIAGLYNMTQKAAFTPVSSSNLPVILGISKAIGMDIAFKTSEFLGSIHPVMYSSLSSVALAVKDLNNALVPVLQSHFPVLMVFFKNTFSSSFNLMFQSGVELSDIFIPEKSGILMWVLIVFATSSLIEKLFFPAPTFVICTCGNPTFASPPVSVPNINSVPDDVDFVELPKTFTPARSKSPVARMGFAKMAEILAKDFGLTKAHFPSNSNITKEMVLQRAMRIWNLVPSDFDSDTPITKQDIVNKAIDLKRLTRIEAKKRNLL